jgi:cytoskeletal protein RodZ
MSDGDYAEPVSAGPRSVGSQLRAAREGQGLSIADVAARTRVTQRFLEAIEQDRLDLLPSPAYASGFARAYARAVGLDQVQIGREVRDRLAAGAMPPRYHPVEAIADPARGPSRTTVIVAAGLALAVLVLAVLWFATGMLRGTGNAPVVATGPAVSVPTPAASAAVPPPAAANKVVLTAADEVWLRVYDGANQTLFVGTMKPGQTFEVPATADRPMINVGRPDKLNVTVDGVAIAPLGDGKRPIKDVAVTAAALRARGAAGATPAPTATPTGTATAGVPSAFASPAR